MDAWFIVILFIPLFVPAIISFFSASKKPFLPPGPTSIPILGNLIWLRHSISLFKLEILIRKLHAQIGPIITLRFGSFISIFIADRHLAHKALVELGALFSSRPPPSPLTVLNSRVKNISASPYDNIWRLLRRNLTSEILHPAKLRLFAHGRRRVLSLLLRDLEAMSEQSPQRAVVPFESFQFAIYGITILMCFGEKIGEEAIREIQSAQRELLLYSSTNFRFFSFVPKFLSRFIFQRRLKTLLRMRERQIELFLPLINARRENRRKEEEERYAYSYVDSLFGIRLQDEIETQLTDIEIILLCSEFLIAGTETTVSVLQWIMAEIVAQPAIQAKMIEEMESLNGDIREEDLQKLPYLKAVIMEGLRRRPPGHFVLPHSVIRDVEFEGYLIPKNASINFAVADFGWDEKVWEEAMEFKPERFMAGGEGEGVDISGSREIKMMPFGAGRRICPGIGLAMLHLEYFVANLVREFVWEAIEGEEIDFSEKTDFVVVMKKPLRARITPRNMVC